MQGKTTILSADRDCFAEKTVRLAAGKFIRLITTDMNGKPRKAIYSNFVSSIEDTEVNSCPGGHKVSIAYSTGSQAPVTA